MHCFKKQSMFSKTNLRLKKIPNLLSMHWALVKTAFPGTFYQANTNRITFSKNQFRGFQRGITLACKPAAIKSIVAAKTLLCLLSQQKVHCRLCRFETRQNREIYGPLSVVSDTMCLVLCVRLDLSVNSKKVYKKSFFFKPGTEKH